MENLAVQNFALQNSVVSNDSVSQLERIRNFLSDRVSDLFESRYFTLCRTGGFRREQLMEVVRQLYCFSTFFERILTRRMSKFTSSSPYPLVRMARTHLREEIGHVDLFRKCLVNNDFTHDEILQITPTLHTKALFGYLLATVEYENEIVANVAIMQVMELIGMHFFDWTLQVMEQHNIETSVFAAHAEDDRTHSVRGMELLAQIDEQTAADCIRVIGDLFRLMTAALDEWIS